VFLSYLWYVNGCEPMEAHTRFQGILEAQRSLYSSAWSREVSANVYQQGNILVGQLYSDPGVIGWKPWVEHNGLGLVWNGVCESFLGTEFNAKSIQDVEDTLSSFPRRVCSWDGNFYVISWNRPRETVCLTTGATACPTLWFTEGPYGWAAGSRGEPILEMVGREKRLSTAANAVYLSYGYNYSDASLLEYVHRIPQRTQITAQPGAWPRMSRYATIHDYLGDEVHCNGREQLLLKCADRLIERVGRQLQYSTHPEVLITGGRDSRCIAAAAKRAGYRGEVSTGGAADCRDVVIGKEVANRLKLTHRHTSDRVPIVQLSNAVERLKLWSSMSEGMEVIRHVRAYNHFVTGEVVSGERQQLIHGLGGEIGRGYYYHHVGTPAQLNSTDYTIGRQILLAAANPSISMKSAANALLDERWDSFSRDFDSTHGTLAHWLDMFFWQNSCLHWGADMLSAKSTMYWTWSPFLDREIIKIYQMLDPEDKRSSQFIQDLALTLASELEGLEYDIAQNRKTNSLPLGDYLLTRFRYTLKKGLRRNSAAAAQCRELKQFWEKVLLGTKNPFWKECIDESVVRKLMLDNPSSEVLWNAATSQLVADVCN